MIDQALVQQAFAFSLVLFLPVFTVSIVVGLASALVNSWLRVDDRVSHSLFRIAACSTVAYFLFDLLVSRLSEYSEALWGSGEFYF